MGSEASYNKVNSEFIFHSSISKNVYDGAWMDFLGKLKKKEEFKRSKKKINEYINDMVVTGKLSHEKLNLFLLDEIFYGLHKDVLIYRFNNDELLVEDEVVEILENNFKRGNLRYNELDRTVFIKEGSVDEDLAAIETEINEVTKQITKVKLVFVKKVKYTTKENKMDYGKSVKIEIPHEENSYIPIELDFIEKRLIVKSAPKTRIKKADYKGVNLSQYFANRVIKSFGLELISHQLKYQKTLHNMCEELLEDVIKEKCKYEISEFDSIICDEVKKFEDKFKALGINIKELKDQVKTKNVFDIHNQISSMIENVVISKILIEAMKSKEGLEGIISYIKFKDRTAVNTVLKTMCRKDTLLDSQAYLDLRKTLQQSKLVEKIRVVWFKKKEEIQLSYDCKHMMYIHIHFYERLFKGDLKYAIERIEDFTV